MMNLVTRVKFAGCNSMIVRRFFSARASSTRKSHYETLNVTANASKKEIRDAYIQKSKVELSHLSGQNKYITINILQLISSHIDSIFPLAVISSG